MPGGRRCASLSALYLFNNAISAGPSTEALAAGVAASPSLEKVAAATNPDRHTNLDRDQ